MQKIIPTIAIVAALLLANGCKRSEKPADSSAAKHSHAPDHSHDATGADHSHGAADADHAGGEGHTHDEIRLGKTMIGGHEVQFAQSHGEVEAGKEGHILVKLPYNDNGDTIVRAWLGTEDRTRSMVGKGEYEPARYYYDVHAVAPDPLPENVLWWIEIEKPDGTKAIGSIKPKL